MSVLFIFLLSTFESELQLSPTLSFSHSHSHPLTLSNSHTHFLHAVQTSNVLLLMAFKLNHPCLHCRLINSYLQWLSFRSTLPFSEIFTSGIKLNQIRIGPEATRSVISSSEIPGTLLLLVNRNGILNTIEEAPPRATTSFT